MSTRWASSNSRAQPAAVRTGSAADAQGTMADAASSALARVRRIVEVLGVVGMGSSTRY
jgi:hypothetical protein